MTPAGDVRSFAYHRSIAPTLGVLLALALVETVVLHIVAMGLWGRRVAILLAIVDLSFVAALVGLLRAIRRHPVTIADGVVTMRVGALKVIPIPFDHLAGLRGAWDGAAIRQRGVVNLALASWPNVVVDVSPPIRWRGREVVAVAHRLDDPAAFSATIDAVRRGHGGR